MLFPPSQNSTSETCHDETCRRIHVQALVISRLDYCNSVLFGLASSTLQLLSSVLQTAARLIKDLSPKDHITYTETFIHSFIHSGDLYSASSRDYYSEALPAQPRTKKDLREM